MKNREYTPGSWGPRIYIIIQTRIMRAKNKEEYTPRSWGPRIQKNTHQDHKGQGSHASSQDDERKLCGLHPAHCIYYFVFCNLLLSLFFHWIHHLISLFFKCTASYFIIGMAWGLKLRLQVFTAPFTKNDIRGEIYLYLLISFIKLCLEIYCLFN